MKRLESIAHIAMGLGAALVGLGLLLHRREWRQLPPENDANPVLWIKLRGAQHSWSVSHNPFGGGDQYWSKARVMDTLRDLREYQIGATIAWPCVLGAGIAIGLALGSG